MGALLERYKKEFVPRFDKDGITPYLSYKDFENLNYFEGKFKNSIKSKTSLVGSLTLFILSPSDLSQPQ